VNEAAGDFESPSPRESQRSANREPNIRIVITERMTTRSRLALTLGAAALLAGLGGGCGSSRGGDYGGEHPDYATALAGSPAPLAALHDQANRLLPGGPAAYERRIASLRGYPVVANVWASWCGPCRLEFPVLQKLAARYGKRVAFLGVNSQDSDDTAASFLEEAPVPYPSYTDPDQEIASSLKTRGLPDTAFYDRAGKLVFLKIGPYEDAAELEADVRRYALKSG
jgi:cytochrome c biogenesis protein CcmG, thiol:disulfide interchange protein DsbE